MMTGMETKQISRHVSGWNAYVVTSKRSPRARSRSTGVRFARDLEHAWESSRKADAEERWITVAVQPMEWSDFQDYEAGRLTLADWMAAQIDGGCK